MEYYSEMKGANYNTHNSMAESQKIILNKRSHIYTHMHACGNKCPQKGQINL